MYFTRTYLGEVDSLLLSEDNHQEEDSHHQQGGSQSQEGIQGQVGNPHLVQVGNLWQEGIHQWEDIQDLEDNQAENGKQKILFVTNQDNVLCVKCPRSDAENHTVKSGTEISFVNSHTYTSSDK